MSAKTDKKQSDARPFGRGRGGPQRRFNPVEKPKNAKSALLRLWKYLRVEKLILAIVALFILINSVLNIIAPYILGLTVDTALENNSLELLAYYVVIIAVLYFFSALLAFCEQYIMIGASQKAIKQLRQDLFSKVQDLSINFFDTHSHGELMSRITNDIDNISNTLSSSFIQLTESIILILGISIVMLVLNWRLAIICLVTVPVVIFGIKPLVKKTRAGYKKQQVSLGKLNGLIEETVSGQRVIKAFCREKAVLEEFDKINNDYTSAAIKANILAGIMPPLMNVISNLNFIIVVSAGSILTLRNLATIGTIASFVNYVRQFSRPLNEVATLFNSFQSALAGAERVFEILDMENEIIDTLEPIKIDKFRGHVVFKNVYFSYIDGQPILKDINFEVLPGQLVALVGPTGAGKTTIVNLLSRFYDVKQGKIEIDGVNIKDIEKELLRKRLGIVLQDSYLFSGKIKDAIAYGLPTASDEDILKAAKVANVDSFIHRLTDGFDAMLVSQGANLSQGQRQLITIARAALVNPDILILDEATSSVDTRTEQMIQEAMHTLMTGRTSFVIAHRLSTIRNADKIIVVDDGMIVEEGTHEELIENRGFYYDLYFSQFAFNNAAS